MSHILEVEGLTTVFDGDGGQMTSADGISFYVDPGEIVCIVGESGCGKSVKMCIRDRLIDDFPSEFPGNELAEHSMNDKGAMNYVNAEYFWRELV